MEIVVVEERKGNLEQWGDMDLTTLAGGLVVKAQSGYVGAIGTGVFASASLGGWLFVSPWILNFTGTELVARNAWLFGVIVAVLAVLALFAYEKWEEWLNAAIGVWIFVSPWVLGAAASAHILWNSMIVGALLVILALWSVSLEHGPGAIASNS